MRTSRMRLTIAALAASIGAGCAASGPQFQKIPVPAGKSVVYAYRPTTLAGGAIKPTLACGTARVVLPRGGYYPFVVEPGNVVCHAATEASSTVEVDARPNEAAYVKETIGIGILVGRPHLQVVPPSVGASEIGECSLQQPE